MDNNKLTFKEIITNKQYRSIFSLMIYFVIIVILIIIVRITNGPARRDAEDNKDDILMTEFNSIKNKISRKVLEF